MKYLSILTLFLLAIIAPAHISLSQTTPADTKTAEHSKQDAKATKQKPSPSKTTPQTKSSGPKKTTKQEDSAYASAYKAGTTEQNKGPAPK